ncbi:MAG TPA: RbsD/FucU domain-containing protein [Microbacteriaceae bacterium]|nr:RbsD/FucU domain-containing protein [Microbacteriaceae bacterium]
MLKGLDPLLTGQLLQILDEMGHSDTIVVTDAHFPAASLATRLIALPGVGSPEVVRAICSVLPLDQAPTLALMTSASGEVLPVHSELMAAAGVAQRDTRFVDRFAYYDEAKAAFAIVRTGERRTYANALLSKGVVATSAEG